MLSFRTCILEIESLRGVKRRLCLLTSILLALVLAEMCAVQLYGEVPSRPSWLPAIPPRVTWSTQEDVQRGYFSDVSPSHDGGVAHPADGSTGNALQQTMIDAYFWTANHGNTFATVVIAGEYEIYTSNLWVPTRIHVVCSSFAPMTYSGGCGIHNIDTGNNTATGGSPLIVLDYTFGVLADHKTICHSYDSPQQPGCIIIGSEGASIDGMTLYGGGVLAGGADVGIRVAENSVSISNTTTAGFFGGPGIQSVGGVNQSYAWNFGTNVNEWWCANPMQFNATNLLAALDIPDGNLGGLDVGMTDGYLLYNQYSTGCAFAHQFHVRSFYPHMGAMHVYGDNNDVESNLGQVDAIGLILDGSSHRVAYNRFEYQGREAVRNDSFASIFVGNYVTSGCLDPNLSNLRPGAPNKGKPAYPSTPTVLPIGYIFEDSNGNVEEVVDGNQGGNTGTTDETAPIWPAKVGDTVTTTQLTFQNVGVWEPGLTQDSDPGAIPAETSGICLPVMDYGIGNDWSDTQVIEQAGVNGPSFSRGSYFIPYPGKLSDNSCSADLPDTYGNGQCWWGGDLFSNGGPPYLAPNGQTVYASGGGTAWVGDYSDLRISDLTAQHYNNFQGMAQGQDFSITAANAPAEIDTWGVNGGGSVYGHPSVHTCNTVPLIITHGAYYTFHYDLDSAWAVTQTNCGSPAAATLTLTTSSNPLKLGANLLINASVAGAGLLPTGIVSFSLDGSAIQSTGVFGGTASTVVKMISLGEHLVTATYSGDVNYAQSQANLTETVVPDSAVALSPSSLASGMVGSAYSQILTVSGMTSPYTFASIGSLPPGVALSTTGMLRGVPTLAGFYPFTITVAGVGAQSTSLPYTIKIAPAPLIAIVPAALSGGIAGVPYSVTLSARGGVAPYKFALVTGSLPRGLNLSNAGVISGTPTTGSTVSFGVSATDSSVANYEGSQNYTLSVATANNLPVSTASILLTPTSPTVVVVNSGGSAMYTFQVAPSGADFSGDVSFSTSGLPPGATFTLSPSVLPAGSTETSLKLVVQTSASTAILSCCKMGGSLSFVLMPLLMFRQRKRGLNSAFRTLIVVSMISFITGLDGCGVTNTPPKQTVYSINVTAATSNAKDSATIQLIVQ